MTDTTLTHYRTALITGASSGIGRELAKRLAARGINLALLARRPQALDSLVEELGTQVTVRAVPTDVANTSITHATIQQLDHELGGIDLVIANAGQSAQVWSGELTWQHAEPLLATNVMGAAATLVALIPQMVARGHGHLVGVSSLAGYRALPHAATYSASKAFLATFLEGLRMDLRGTGVSVTDVRPGFVRTAMTAKNKHPMPFLMDVDTAGDIIEKAIFARKEVCAFPWPMVSAVNVGRIAPRRFYEAFAKKARNARANP